jgi:predicted TIM-barrel fold metal-dependent hydrolase
LFLPDIRATQRSDPRFQTGGWTSTFDPARRLKELDEDGVVAEILFPDDQNSNTPGWLAGIAPHALDRSYAPKLRLAGARAYNRWLAEFCAADPTRLIGTIVLGSLEDVDAAVAEVRRAFASGLTKTVMLPLDYYLPLYHHPRYEPFWSVCEELDIVVTIHGSDGGPSWYGDGYRGCAVFFAEVMWHAHRPLWCLILGGVFEHHPKLRVAFTEQGSSWVRPVLDQLDALAASTMARWAVAAPLPMRPTEYFARNCTVGNSIMQRSDVEQRAEVGVANLMWGSDFPHFEGMWPFTHERLQQVFEGVPATDARPILGENLIAFYRLEERALRAKASQIGPSAAHLGLAP